MNITISLNKDQVYMKSDKSREEGGFSFTMYRENGQDYVGIDGNEEYRDWCLKVADALLEKE